MSDLQCPCVVLLIAGEAFASPDCERALRAEHLAAFIVAGSIDVAAREVVARFAHETSNRFEVVADVVDGASLRRAIDDLSDRYRGETIAVIAGAANIAGALGTAGQLTKPLTVSIDASGWTMQVQPSR